MYIDFLKSPPEILRQYFNHNDIKKLFFWMKAIQKVL